MNKLNVTEENIDELIETWHNGDSKQPLHEFLGLTFEQYSHWVQTGKFIIN